MSPDQRVREQSDEASTVTGLCQRFGGVYHLRHDLRRIVSDYSVTEHRDFSKSFNFSDIFEESFTERPGFERFRKLAGEAQPRLSGTCARIAGRGPECSVRRLPGRPPRHTDELTFSLSAQMRRRRSCSNWHRPERCAAALP